MTGDKELLEGEMSETGGDVDGPDWFWTWPERGQKPTWRTFGSMTREYRRGSISGGKFSFSRFA